MIAEILILLKFLPAAMPGAFPFAHRQTAIAASVTVHCIVVAGGGSGNINRGGGGGGGGVIPEDKCAFTAKMQPYTVTVGSGGGVGSTHSDGSDSSIVGKGVSFIAKGGGQGGSQEKGGSSTSASGGPAGSGGGAGGDSSGASGGSAVAGQGSAGGNNIANGHGGGGGGGASAIGSSGTENDGGNGGNGYTSKIDGNIYGCGGGGSGPGTQGQGGCTNAGNAQNSPLQGGSAAANRGGGGGGQDSGNPGAGGSGIVIFTAPEGKLSATGGTHFTTSKGACGSSSCDVWAFTSSGTFQIESDSRDVDRLMQAICGNEYYIKFARSSIAQQKEIEKESGVYSLKEKYQAGSAIVNFKRILKIHTDEYKKLTGKNPDLKNCKK